MTAAQGAAGGVVADIVHRACGGGGVTDTKDTVGARETVSFVSFVKIGGGRADRGGGQGRGEVQAHRRG